MIQHSIRSTSIIFSLYKYEKGVVFSPVKIMNNINKILYSYVDQKANMNNKLNIYIKAMR